MPGKLERLFETMPIGVCLVDTDLRYLHINEALADFNGVPAEEHIGRTLQEVIPDVAPVAVPLFRRVLETGEAYRDIEVRSGTQSQPDVVRDWLIDLYDFRGADGVLVGVLMTLQDITARKLAETTVREQRNTLAHVQRVATLGELSTALAHEIGQPLAAILANAEAASRFLDSDTPDLGEVRSILGDIIADERRANNVIVRLRALLKKQPPAYERLGVNVIVEEVMVLLRSDSVFRGITVELHLEEGLPPIRGDRVQLQQVLLNLLMNGFDAMEGESPIIGTMAVHTSQVQGAAVRVDIRDAGTGLEGRDAEALFEPLYTTKGKGLGMGLAVCRSIVEAHGGKIWAEANTDRGATFSFTLPVDDPR